MAKITKKGKVPAKLEREETKLPPAPTEASENTEEETSSENSDEAPEEAEPAKLKSSAENEDSPAQKSSVVEDYIQQYQYKKVNDVPTIGGPGTNPDKSSKAERMKNALLAQRRVSIMIPLEFGSDPKVPASVCLNGYRLDFPTQTYIEVPEQVAEVVMQSQRQTVAALDPSKIGGNHSIAQKEQALGAM